MADVPLTLAGRYRLDQIIGRGGMAEVWQGRDLLLDRDVAIKRLRADLATDPTFQARFQREAHSAAGLNHPNIVSVYDTGSQVDAPSGVAVPYIVMELVHGRTLRDLLASGTPIPPADALRYTEGVLDALAYSHRRGIVHRDIKPANVMLTTAGTIKVMDFGIARAVADTSATMTQTAAVIGTAQYLSPEQARGETVDARSDVYSTGCLLYELLTRRPPFIGDSPVSVAYQHVREMPVPPSQLNPSIPPPVDAIVMQSLAKNPSDRYQGAQDMRDDIMRALSGHAVQAGLPVVVPLGAPAEATKVLTPAVAATPPARAEITHETGPLPLAAADDDEDTRRRMSPALIVLIVIAVIAVGVIGFFLWKITHSTPPAPETVAVPQVVGLGYDANAASQAIGKVQLTPVAQNVKVGVDAACTLDLVGQVVEQDPKADTQVALSYTVTFKVCQGPDSVVIPPNLKGLTVDEAKKQLTDLRWVGQVKQQPALPADEPIDLSPGQVVDTIPAAGQTVGANDPITIIVATGKSLIPDVAGKSLTQATTDLANKGFINLESTTKHEWSSTVPKGWVIDTAPGAGTAYLRTGTVTLIMSDGPEPVTPTSTSQSATPSHTPPTESSTETPPPPTPQVGTPAHS
ncbi:MAG: Stk1 family PASTA domain-containing Ser/Thr kinase [Actinomycetia bacterium]|nr:Stk1 family PASTA domain-containing Ser/Thr kinase [Actinomycetes bacterium]